ncbi:hypothetical protein V6U81_24425 [Micromonospora sp. CPCC 205711]|uniref:hypothetical protein n=1 Tax=Micromonospora sp. CPCC 205547 TaxID=3122400 RepID=UPI002FF29285
MTDQNETGTGRLPEEDLKVLIGVAAHLESIFLVDEGPQEVFDALLARLRHDMVRFGLIATDSKADVRAGIQGLNVRLRRALGEDLPPGGTT